MSGKSSTYELGQFEVNPQKFMLVPIHIINVFALKKMIIDFFFKVITTWLSVKKQKTRWNISYQSTNNLKKIPNK